MTLETVWDGTQTVPPGHTKGELITPHRTGAGWWLYLEALGRERIDHHNADRHARVMSLRPKTEVARRTLLQQRVRQARREA